MWPFEFWDPWSNLTFTNCWLSKHFLPLDSSFVKVLTSKYRRVKMVKNKGQSYNMMQFSWINIKCSSDMLHSLFYTKFIKSQYVNLEQIYVFFSKRILSYRIGSRFSLFSYLWKAFWLFPLICSRLHLQNFSLLLFNFLPQKQKEVTKI